MIAKYAPLGIQNRSQIYSTWSKAFEYFKGKWNMIGKREGGIGNPTSSKEKQNRWGYVNHQW